MGDLEIDFPITGCSARFDSIPPDRGGNKRGLLQSIVNTLCRRGFYSAVAPFSKTNEYDIAILGTDADSARRALSRYSNLSPVVQEAEFDQEEASLAWANCVRIHLQQNGYMRTGTKYFHESSLAEKDELKDAFRVQADVIKNRPILWLDPSTRIIRTLTDSEIETAIRLGQDSEIRVRLLPRWTQGVLVGRSVKKAGETFYEDAGRKLALPEYWKSKYGIDFVKKDDEILEVMLPQIGKLNYPRSCVFRDYDYGRFLPAKLRKSPQLRVTTTKSFLGKYVDGIKFLGRFLKFSGPTGPERAGFSAKSLEQEKSLILSNGHATTFSNLSSDLSRFGPYSQSLNGKYFVVHPDKKREVVQALQEIERTYSSLKLGKLDLVNEVGENGLLNSHGSSVTDYTSAIAQLRMGLDSETKALGVVVLPDLNVSDVYFRSRQQLFESLYDTPSFPVQSIKLSSIRAINMKDRRSRPICVNTVAQIYIKFGGTGTALWILKDAADSPIPKVVPGTSCYAYHDVSRRYKIKSSATAYSALTDSFGRYIATGTKPIGGERLTPSNFYDILVELIHKISVFSKKYRKIDEERLFSFSRLVFAKDGAIYPGEAEMMEDVIRNGVKEEGKEPISVLLKKNSFLPDNLIIDIISVNKSPCKRLFESQYGQFQNPNVGTVIFYDDKRGLLISSSTYSGTVQPIEITLHAHICLNEADAPVPHISQIIDEYYSLTFLNWSSIYKKSKLALPQILTQNLGENLTAGVMVPDDMVLL